MKRKFRYVIITPVSQEFMRTKADATKRKKQLLRKHNIVGKIKKIR